MYTYDVNNRLLIDVKTAVAVMDTTDYYYDPNGNMIAKTTSTISDGTGEETLSLAEGVAGSWLYRYNGFNQLTGLSSDGLEESYAYAPSGLRVSKTTNGVKTSYVLDGDQVVRESVGGTTTAVYIRGINLICSTIGSDTNYYLYNGHGDVVQLANTSGTVTKEYDYDAFGNEKNPNATDTNPFRYCGEYFDLSSGTYYLRARYYDPAIGRFLSEDSIQGFSRMMPNGQQIADPLSLNLYAYCHNNPVMYVDENGNWIQVAIGALIGGVVGGVINFGTQLISNGGNFQGINWRSVGASATAGVVTGAMAGATAGLSLTLNATVAAGALTAGAGYGTYHFINGSNPTIKGYITAMAMGGLLSGVSYKITNGIPTIQVNKSTSVGKIGHDYENWLVRELKGEGPFKVSGREFDGRLGNI